MLPGSGRPPDVPSLRITVIDHDTSARRQHSTSQLPVRVGRDLSNDLVLPHAYVARWQAVVTVQEGRVFLVMLGASNPLRRKGKALPVGVQVEIDRDDILTLGSLEMHIKTIRPGSGAEQVVHSGPPSPDEAAEVAGVAEVLPDSEASALMRARAAIPHLTALHRRAVRSIASWETLCDDELGRIRDDTRDAKAAKNLLRNQIAVLGPLSERARLPPGPELLSAIGMLGELALELMPNSPPPSDEVTIRRFLSRTAATVKALAAIIVELQRIWADERTRLGIDSTGSTGPLHLSVTELIEGMVDPHAEQQLSDDALIDAAVGLQDHVRSLVRSAETAALDMVSRLAPAAFNRDRGGGLLPWRAASAWRSYRGTYQTLCGKSGELAPNTLRELLRDAYAREVDTRGNQGRS
ncbi:MAG TPA: FHA domain-containing protein [Nannocystis exedens]|nr:FHA domain-containing protein [Nannocystis exedens]